MGKSIPTLPHARIPFLLCHPFRPTSGFRKTFPAASAIPISFLFRGHTDDNPLIKLLLSPDTDDIKKISPGETSDPNDIKVKFQGLDDFLGIPAPCEIYLGRVLEKRRSKAQVLYWQLTGDHCTTPDKDKANMTWMEVAVRMNVGSELQGVNCNDEDVYYLNHLTRPTGSVAVIFPVLVNTKPIERKTPLLVYKEKAPEPAAPENSTKRPAAQISNVKHWDKQFNNLSKKVRFDEM